MARKNGLTRVEYLLPELEELLAETLGVIVYQDQVLQIANRLAGYSLGEADLLRRAMGKKKPEEMAKHRDRFVSGCARNKIDSRKAATLFDLMAEFAGYGFPKAHSTAYALITYQTAYLKANHPREFLAALLSIEAGNHDKLARYIAHAREHKIEVLPPDVNESARDFTPVAEGIRFGLAGVKNVGEGAIESILAVRGEGGPFASLFDFARRVDGRRVNRRVVESLVKCGAFDSLHANRAAVWTALDAALEQGAAAQRDREIGQGSLFGATTGTAGGGARAARRRGVDRRRAPRRREGGARLLRDGPPARAPSPPRSRASTDVSAGTAEAKVGREVRAGGLITALRETRTRRGQTMAFATLEDLEGSFELVIFPDPWTSARDVLKRAQGGGSGGAARRGGHARERATRRSILVRDVFALARRRRAPRGRACTSPCAQRRRRATACSRCARCSSGTPGDCSVVLHLAIPGESETRARAARASTRRRRLLREVDGLFGRSVAELHL